MATFTNDVELTILDGGGVVSVPSANVQLVVGAAPAGPINQVIATRNPSTLKSVFQGGPLVEAGSMTIAGGGIVLAMRAATNTAASLSAVGSTGQTGTSAITVTGTPVDEAYFKVLFDTGQTIGISGIKFRVSMDDGRTYGPQYSLGVANTFLIPDTGVTLNFGAGTIVAGDYVTFKSTEARPNTAGVQACLNAIQVGPYGAAGWGSAHILHPWAGADATAFQGFADAMRTQAKIFTRFIINARDASPPTAYGGTAETEATWMNAIMTDFSGVDAKRVNAVAGHYNMSGQQSIAGVLPRYRRPLSWAVAQRIASIPPQRHAGRVKDGALSILVDPVNDPIDGFIYHDERSNPGLDDARFTSAQTRAKKGAVWWVKNPRLMAAAGSVFWLHPFGAVMDVACDILTQAGQDEINDDVRTTKTGQIDPIDGKNIGLALGRVLKQNMTDAGMISGASVQVDPDYNVRDTGKVKVRATIDRKGYILELDIELAFGSAT